MLGLSLLSLNGTQLLLVAVGLHEPDEGLVELFPGRHQAALRLAQARSEAVSFHASSSEIGRSSLDLEVRTIARHLLLDDVDVPVFVCLIGLLFDG